MAKENNKGIGKETLSTEQDIEQEEQEKKQEQQEQQEHATEQEQQNIINQSNVEKIKYKINYKMLITDFGMFSADENGYIYLTQEQYNKLKKK